jgi:hypothetical protein
MQVYLIAQTHTHIPVHVSVEHNAQVSLGSSRGFGTSSHGRGVLWVADVVGEGAVWVQELGTCDVCTQRR